MRWKKRIPAGLALVLTLAFAWLAVHRLDLADSSYLTSLEMRWIDAKFGARGARPGGNEVVIVGLDEKTLGQLGSARVFQRSHFAALISKLAEGGPKAIGFDITFQDRDVSDSANDLKFAEAIRAADSVVLGLQLYLEPRVGPRRPVQALDSLAVEKQIFPAERKPPVKFFLGKDLKPNLPELTKAAASFGFVNFHADTEGRLRYQPQVIEYGGRLYPSLDLQLLRRYLNAPSVIVDADNVQVGKYRIPTDRFGRLMLNFSGPRGSYQTVSMIDVIEGRTPAELFKDKIVLIGAPTIGLSDVIATPFDPVLPSVELHANVIDNVLHERYLYRQARQEALDFEIIIGFGILLGYFLPKLNATRSLVCSALMLAAFAAFNVWAFIQLQWVLSFVYPGLSLAVTSAALIAYKYLTEERENKRTRQTFQYYLDRHVIEQVLSQPETLKLGGEKRDLTVLFSDIRGFSSLSEKMEPADVVRFLNQYFDKMTGIIFEREGTLDKLMGDAVMCFWGHPIETKDHAVRGVLAALEMIRAVEELRRVLVLPGGAKLEIGIGLNTGPMIVGNMGSQTRFSYTVVGDNVNLGSRLESLNKNYGTKIIISGPTFDEVRNIVLCRELDTIQVKGKSQSVSIYEPIAMRGQATPEQQEIASMYEYALALYRKGESDGAEMAFNHVLSLAPNDGPSRLMKNRIAKYRNEYAGDEVSFNPVYKFDEK